MFTYQSPHTTALNWITMSSLVRVTLEMISLKNKELKRSWLWEEKMKTVIKQLHPQARWVIFFKSIFNWVSLVTQDYFCFVLLPKNPHHFQLRFKIKPITLGYPRFPALQVSLTALDIYFLLIGGRDYLGFCFTSLDIEKNAINLFIWHNWMIW